MRLDEVQKHFVRPDMGYLWLHFRFAFNLFWSTQSVTHKLSGSRILIRAPRRL